MWTMDHRGHWDGFPHYGWGLVDDLLWILLLLGLIALVGVLMMRLSRTPPRDKPSRPPTGPWRLPARALPKARLAKPSSRP